MISCSERVRGVSGVVLVGAVLGFLLFSGGVRAQAGSADPPGYAEALDAALASYGAGHFAEALALFERADGISPGAPTARGIGMAHFELRHYAQSVAALERALALPTRRLSGRVRAETEQLLSRSEGFVGRFTLTLQPEFARVAVDGRAAPDRQRLVLDVGEHVLDVSADGYAAEHQALSIQGGEALNMRFDLSPLPPMAAASSPFTAEQPLTDRPWYANGWVWAGAGAVVVATAVVVMLVLVNRSDETFYGGDTNTVIDLP